MRSFPALVFRRRPQRRIGPPCPWLGERAVLALSRPKLGDCCVCTMDQSAMLLCSIRIRLKDPDTKLNCLFTWQFANRCDAGEKRFRRCGRKIIETGRG